MASKVVIALAIVFGLVGVVAMAVVEARTSVPVEDGQTAPAFEMDKLGGGKVSLSELHGKVVMLDFWATWCHPCTEEIPHLVKLAKEYEGRGLTFVAANRDDPPDQKVQVALWVDKELPPLAPYVGFAPDEMAEGYKVEALPTLYFIDKEGKILEAHRGALSERQLRARIEEVLANN